jgi:two-component system, LytTR family, sensor kinase
MQKPVILLFHIGYWFLYTLFILLILALLTANQQVEPNIPKSHFWVLFGTLTFVPAICGFYAFYTLLFDYFLSKRRIILLFVAGFLTAWLCGVVGVLAMQAGYASGFIFSPFDTSWEIALANANIMAFIALPNGGMGLLLRGFIRWYAELKLKEDLMKQNFETELALVKSQLDPHFLFNTLNNIDALMLKDKNVASAYLNKLSDILRFMLYETKGEKIPLRKECQYIEKYVDLQKIRTANKDFVRLSIEDDTEDAEIAPMILIPFIENAFKHADKLRSGTGILINIGIKDKRLSFSCANCYNENETGISEIGGLGNHLIIKRLELLYPNQHTLSIRKENDWYTVNLAINLTQTT